MNKFTSLSMAALLAALATMPAVAADAVAAPVPVPAQKLDNGLGELPHYRDWTDKTGRNPVSRTTVVVAGEKQDSGLGNLPHYSLWADKAGRVGQQVSQAK